MNPPIKRKTSKDYSKYTDKSSRVQTTISQPSPANNKTVTLPKVKHVAIETQSKLTNIVATKIASSQTENAEFKDASSQTKQVEFKDITSQTEEFNVNFKDASLQRTKFKDTSSQSDKIAARYMIAT